MAALVTTLPTDNDTPWKEAFAYYFEDGLRLLAPWLHAQIDWRHAPVFLNKELQALSRGERRGKRYADKLVQVVSKSQKPFIIMIHIEVQGGAVHFARFGKRMFGYAFRLRERYEAGLQAPDGTPSKLRLVSLGVLTASASQKTTLVYSWDSLGPGSMDFHFPVVHLKTWLTRWDELENIAASNPFALVIMAQLQAQQTAKKGEQRLASKTHIMQLMYRYGYGENDVKRLFRIIDWMMALPGRLEPAFEQAITQIEQENDMAFVTSIERLGEQRGRKTGRVEGRVEGRQEGRVEGRVEGRLEGAAGLLQRQLTHKFGPLPQHLQQCIQSATPKQLETWSLNILDAQTMDEVFGS